MSLFDGIAVILTVTALFSYLNHRFIRLPTVIGVMLISLLLSLALIAAGELGFRGLATAAEELVGRMEFEKTLLHGMLSFLLFAGALHVDINDIRERAWTIASLATVGTLISTVAVAAATFFAARAVGMGLPFVYCLVFGALISPTDPIAVLGILKRSNISGPMRAVITGESLFNDGIGVVLFLVLAGVASSPAAGLVWGGAVKLFVVEALGGLVLGFLLGLVGFLMLRSVDDYQVEVLITLAIVTGGYALAVLLHTSGPIAVVVAGLFIGNHGRLLAMSERTRERLDMFWELVDEILNAVLFVLLGVEIFVIDVSPSYVALGLMVIPLLLLSRTLAVSVPLGVLRLAGVTMERGSLMLLVWGGLRGGISVALALSLVGSPYRTEILTITYVAVIFSVLVQGLTVGRVVAAVARR